MTNVVLFFYPEDGGSMILLRFGLFAYPLDGSSKFLPIYETTRRHIPQGIRSFLYS
jgi:hypothetical protein